MCLIHIPVLSKRTVFLTTRSIKHGSRSRYSTDDSRNLKSTPASADLVLLACNNTSQVKSNMLVPIIRYISNSIGIMIQYSHQSKKNQLALRTSTCLQRHPRPAQKSESVVLN